MIPKTTQTFLLFLSICFLSFTASAENSPKNGKYTKQKKVEKSFTVNKNATLTIKNRYGNVDVVSWDQNRVEIKVTITTNGNDEEKVQERLDDIQIIFDSNAGEVSAVTQIQKQNSSWWNKWGGNDNISMKINYTVKVPATNNVALSNDYGGISLNRIEGAARISCDYGQIQIGELLSENNQLSFDYTKNSTIGFMKAGKISADYSEFTLEKSSWVDLSADYTKSTFGEIQGLKYSCDYGSLWAENIKNLEGQGDYLSLRLGRVSGNIDVTADYGSIKIEELTESAGNISVRTDYAAIKIGYHSDYHFRFTIDMEYGGLSGESELNITKQKVESSDKYFEGFYGSQNARNRIDLSTEYGSVKLQKL